MKDAYVVLGWLLITGVLNAALSRRTAEEWEALAEKNPRYAAFAGFLRAVGLDPVKLMKSVVDILRGASQKHLGAASCLTASADSTCAPPKDGKPTEEPLKVQDDAHARCGLCSDTAVELPKPEEPTNEAVVADESSNAPRQVGPAKSSSTSVKRNKSAKRKGKR
jgi:hypothetical protein